MMAAVLLVETADGDVVGVGFPSRDAARTWEDTHEDKITVRGCVTLVSRTGALRLAQSTPTPTRH